MPVNSKQKGSRGERELVKLLKSLGYTARRSQQYQGVRDESNSADVIHNIEGVRIEVKLGYNQHEFGSAFVKEWIETAKNETPPYQNWMIFWRKDRKKWMAIFHIRGIDVLTDDIESAIFLNRQPELFPND